MPRHPEQPPHISAASARHSTTPATPPPSVEPSASHATPPSPIHAKTASIPPVTTPPADRSETTTHTPSTPDATPVSPIPSTIIAHLVLPHRFAASPATRFITRFAALPRNAPINTVALCDVVPRQTFTALQGSAAKHSRSVLVRADIHCHHSIVSNHICVAL